MSKSIAKKSSKKAVVVVKKARKLSPLHEKLIKLLMRPGGATQQDIATTKFYGPAIAAMRIVERRGYRTKVVKPKTAGELTRYVAAKRAGA
jgi:hypothetical protein